MSRLAPRKASRQKLSTPLGCGWAGVTGRRIGAGFRKTMAPLLVACFWALPGPSAPADSLMLRPAQSLRSGASSLDPGDYAIPCVTDWNGDGRMDLIVGYRSADKLALYLNSGTVGQPVFTGFSNLKAAGADIYQAGLGCGAPAPWVCDYDGDGKRDLLVGNGTDGRVYFYRNTNTDAQPTLAAGVAVPVGSNPLSVGSRATPYTHDWDEDGRCDLLVGDGLGNVHFFKNVGTSRSPTNAADLLLTSGGTNLNLGLRSVVRVFDWDGDGRKDLVGSSSTGVYWCRNTGSNTDPVLAAPVSLRSPVSGSGAPPISTGSRMRLDLADWNNDGVMDLLLGNTDGSVFYYEGYHFRIESPAIRPGGGVILRWQSAPFLTYHVLTGAAPQSLPQVAVSNLSSGGNTTTWTNLNPGAVQFFRVQLPAD